MDNLTPELWQAVCRLESAAQLAVSALERMFLTISPSVPLNRDGESGLVGTYQGLIRALHELDIASGVLKTNQNG